MGLNSINFRAWFHAHQISACVMIEKTDNCKREISNRKGYEMKIVAMMPARLGSTRVKNKNLRLINKKPLIQYIIDTAIKTKLLDQIYVNSESKIFQNLSKKSEIEFYKRSEELTSDTSSYITGQTIIVDSGWAAI